METEILLPSSQDIILTNKRKDLCLIKHRSKNGGITPHHNETLLDGRAYNLR
jgi:hypothetical protein